jgi:[ribosomal protein S18]-alanine N-acetyltransferase
MVAAASEALGIPKIVPRAMSEADLPAVLALELNAYAFPWTEGIFRDCLRVGYYCSVLEIDYVLVGYGVISSAAGEAHLLNLCVREEFRCRGLGRRLLEHLLDLVAHSGARIVFLEVRPANTGAVRLYEAMHFQQVGMRRGYYQAEGGREDALVMRRDLTV